MRSHLDRCIRLLPHDNDAGGFFCAVFVKHATTAGAWEHSDGDRRADEASTADHSDAIERDPVPVRVLGAWTDPESDGAGEARADGGSSADLAPASIDGASAMAVVLEGGVDIVVGSGTGGPDEGGAPAVEYVDSTGNATSAVPDATLLGGETFQGGQRYREVSRDDADAQAICSFYGVESPLHLFSFVDKVRSFLCIFLFLFFFPVFFYSSLYLFRYYTFVGPSLHARAGVWVPTSSARICASVKQN